MRSKTLKRAAAFAAAVIMSLGTISVMPEGSLPQFSFTAFAETTVVESGQCGDNVFYELDSEGVLTISGTGNMYNYNSYCDNPSPFYKSKEIKSVIINSGVTSIGEAVFESCYDLTSIRIPDSVTSIGYSAFSFCHDLINITIPDSVTIIDWYAFDGCNSLTSIIIPDKVSSIGGYTFRDCDSLTSITIPDSVTSIGGYAFYDCDNITSIIIPDSVSFIGGSAFNSCDRLTSITIPDSVTSIGDSVFKYCVGLTSITIPDGVTSIGAYAFSRCTSLTSITIPDSVTSIGEYAFGYCYDLTSITIPDGVTSIGNYTFYDCRQLTSVTIPNGVTSIGEKAFSGCKKLNSITIPDKVTSIEDYAFMDCDSLTNITIPNEVTELGEGVFSDCNNITEITLSNKLTSIKDYTFNACNLKEIIIPEGVTQIGRYIFKDCKQLKKVTLPISVTSIDIYNTFGNATIYGYTGSYAETYANNNNIPFVALDDTDTPSDPTETPLENFEIVRNYDDQTNETYKIIGYEGTDENVVIPASCADGDITSIYQYVFSGNTVKSVTVSKNITDIDSAAFSNAAALENIYVNENNTAFKAQDGILYNYNMTKLLCYPEGKTETEFVVPDSVTAIGNLAFSGAALEKITIGKNVIEISANTFLSSDITIYGYKNSYAETYANEKNIPFVALDGGNSEDPAPDPDPCEHTYATTYSYDASGHWYECTKCHKKQIGSQSAHSFGDSVVTKEPTETETGISTATCKYCGYISTTEMPCLGNTIYVNEGESYTATLLDAGKNFVVNGGKLTLDQYRAGSVTVNSGEAYGGSGTIDSVIINGGIFSSQGKINGDVLVTGESGFLNTQIGGTYYARGGTEIGGNLTIEKNGVFEMNGGNVKVCKNFTFASKYEQETALLSGSLWICGDFTQKNQPFKPYGKQFTVIFYGSGRKTITYKDVVIENLWLTPDADDGTNLNQVFKFENAPSGIFRCNSAGTKIVESRYEYLIDYISYSSWQKELAYNMDKLYDSYAQLTNNNFGVIDGITIDDNCKKEINRQVIAWYAIISSDYATDTKEFNKGCGIQFKNVPVKVNKQPHTATITFGFVDFKNAIKNSPYLSTKPVTGGMTLNGIHYIIEVDGMNKTSSGTYSLTASTDQTKFAKAVVDTINDGVKSDMQSLFQKLGLSAFKITKMTSNQFVEAILQTYDNYKKVKGEVNKYKSTIGLLTPIYIAKYQIDQHCPVDTYVYDENGILIASIINDEVVMDSEDVVIWTDGESKFIRFNNDKYTVKTIGNDSGTMDCEIRQYNDKYELVKWDKYNALAVSDGKSYVSETNGDEKLVLMEEDSDVKIPIEPDEEYLPERHQYKDTWSWNSTYHWHECSCGDKIDVAEHIPNNGVVTKQPTSTSTGVRTYSCTVCGYVLKTETIPATDDTDYPTYPTYTIPVIYSPIVFSEKVTVKAEPKDNTVTIKWDEVEDADKYIIYQYKNGKYVKVKETTKTSIKFTKLKNGQTYKFLVRYTIDGKLSPTAYSSKFTVTVYYKPIAKATATQNSVKLNWKAVDGAEKYAIYKYVDGKAVNLSETEKLAVNIRKLKSDTEYKYIVRAYVDGKWTAMTKSDIVTVKTKAE